MLAAYVARENAHGKARTDASPLVTVVLPAYNHARYVAEAIASVDAQTYANLELVVIDDGSTDATAAAVADCLGAFTRPVRFVQRANRGAPATLNEGAALARGQYLAFLNSDDRYAPERIAILVDAIARGARPWGFSLVSSAFGDADSPPADGAVDILQKQRNLLGTQPPSFTLVEYNVAVSSGNLFVERDFFRSLGGFRDYRYNHDWDFCLRAAAAAEPVVVERPLYFYRVHAGNTIAESKTGRGRMPIACSATSSRARFRTSPTERNDLGPCCRANRTLLLRQLFRGGKGALVPPMLLRSLADAWRTAPVAVVGAPASQAATVSLRKTALVVLGMHRSGTSAMSRVLNLCGAFLPAKLMPAKLGVNPRGFWEPEAVLDLNVRAMRQLGGDWCRVNFTLPDTGEFVDEFVADACALLASEYEGRDLIAIKDPRICVLAPLWHRALAAAGYRPAYVVPVRNPLEVAQSLHARGDMSIDEGLELWRAHMERVVAFADAHADVVFVRYTDLLDDWRRVIGRIAGRLDVPLDAGGNVDEVQRFLDKGLRNQAAGDDALDTRLTGSSGEAIRALYRDCLARCDDAATDTSSAHASRCAEEERHLRGANANATACFVLCIENNAIREQALLLCRSIRQFAGRYNDAHDPRLCAAPGPRRRCRHAPGAGSARCRVRRRAAQHDLSRVPAGEPRVRRRARGAAFRRGLPACLRQRHGMARRTRASATSRCGGPTGRFEGQRQRRSGRSLRALLGAARAAWRDFARPAAVRALDDRQRAHPRFL